MESEASALHAGTPRPPAPAWLRPLHRVENALLVIALVAMAILPLAEIGLRRAAGVGIQGSAAIVQHLTLAIGMLGVAVAAREGQLLSFATATNLLGGRAAAAARIFGSAFGATIAGALCAAGIDFARSERESSLEIAYGVPVWVAQILIPAGFALVALRLVWNASPSARGRASAAALALLAGWIALDPPVDPSLLRWPALALLALAVLASAPIFAVLGGAVAILYWTQGDPIVAIPIDQYRLATNYALPTLPLFTLAGYLLAEGGASRRLVRVFQALFGWMRGGPAVGTALVCAFFTTFTGASGVTILALGGLLMPVLLSAGFGARPALGMLTSAGSLGMLFPPCLPLILYAIIASSNGQTQIAIEDMFLAGLLPGIVLVVLTAAWGVRQSPKRRPGDPPRARFDAREARTAVWDAKWELLVPVVACVALFSGWATPVEAAAVTAVYCFAIEAAIYRDLGLRDKAPRALVECGLLMGGVLAILGCAMAFAQWLIDAQAPEIAVEWAGRVIESRWVFLLALNVLLLPIGGLMDVYAALAVVVPILIPLADHYGIAPLHMGVIFLANMELGFLAPPVGLNLLLASYRFGKPLGEVMRSVFAPVTVQFVGLMLITYVPWLSLWLPALRAG